MGWLNKKTEKRATEEEAQRDDILLCSFLNGTTTVTREQALQIPSVKSAINFIADTVSMLPIKLYQEYEGKTEEVKGDSRIKLLNDDTGDTLDAVQFWRAMVTDYFLSKGGYAYIHKERNHVKSLHYVEETHISVSPNTDPIFKDFDILVNGLTYKPYDFLKILRNTKNGAEGKSIIEENNLILSVVYSSLLFEEQLVKKGGNKKGFLKAAGKLSKEALDSLKDAWRNLYSNNTDNVVILNSGMEFQEASNTSVEMQLNENKQTNSTEICKIFNISESIIKGNATPKDYSNSFKAGVMPVLVAIQSALNRDILLEKEKGSLYWAFDTKELMKGDIKERFEAYKTAVEANILQIDEARYMEDLPALGIDWIKLSLDSVLYNPKTHEIYTPNNNSAQNMTKLQGGEKNENRNP